MRHVLALIAGLCCWQSLEALAQPAAMDSLVSVDWLHSQLSAEDIVVIDSTVLVQLDEHGNMHNVSGHSRYRSGHIPGTVFADLLRDFAAPDVELGMPSPDALAAALGAIGVSHEDRVIIYSTDINAWAARLWWMLRWLGHQQVAVLDGGYAAWEAAGHASSTALPVIIPATYEADLQAHLISNKADVLAAIEDPATHLLDALPRAHYAGDFSLYDRAGHIPTAVNIPTAELSGVRGLLRPVDELALLMDVPAGERVITYCGGGVAASMLAFAAHRAGITNVSVYMNSLQEWTADPNTPMKLGAHP